MVSPKMVRKRFTENDILASAGAASALATVALWENWEGHTQFRAQLEASPLSFIEHYHWGMASLLVGGPFFTGVGAVLIGSELFGATPFGIGKPEEETRGNLAVAAVLAGLLLAKHAHP